MVVEAGRVGLRIQGAGCEEGVQRKAVYAFNIRSCILLTTAARSREDMNSQGYEEKGIDIVHERVNAGESAYK